MFSECNSSYKLAKDPTKHIDPLHAASGSTRRKSFYSYAVADSAICIEISLSGDKLPKLGLADITLNISSQGRIEEVETWKEIFGVEERYKDKVCARNDGEAWLEQAIDECANYGLSNDEYLKRVCRAVDRSPFDGANFLKRPFLLACKNAGAF